MCEWVELTENVAVEVSRRDDRLFDVAVMTKWFNSDPWGIEEDYVESAKGLSSMQVYGYNEYEVKEAYL